MRFIDNLLLLFSWPHYRSHLTAQCQPRFLVRDHTDVFIEISTYKTSRILKIPRVRHFVLHYDVNCTISPVCLSYSIVVSPLQFNFDQLSGGRPLVLINNVYGYRLNLHYLRIPVDIWLRHNGLLIGENLSIWLRVYNHSSAMDHH